MIFFWQEQQHGWSPFCKWYDEGNFSGILVYIREWTSTKLVEYESLWVSNGPVAQKWSSASQICKCICSANQRQIPCDY